MALILNKEEDKINTLIAQFDKININNVKPNIQLIYEEINKITRCILLDNNSLKITINATTTFFIYVNKENKNNNYYIESRLCVLEDKDFYTLRHYNNIFDLMNDLKLFL